MKAFDKLLLENKIWVDEKTTKDPDYFKRLSQEQKPEILWIGCADSRVPCEVIVNADPGEIFVHRNIANQVIATDFNSISVIQYAVQVLEVPHIIVCGHYSCGGIKAALEKQRSDIPIVNKWLVHIKHTYRLHQKEMNKIEDPIQKVRRMVELNVMEQVKNLANMSIIQHSWKHRKSPVLHGWVYGLEDGLIKDIIQIDHNYEVDPIYQFVDYDENHL
jgi:carbonic anhydrase